MRLVLLELRVIAMAWSCSVFSVGQALVSAKACSQMASEHSFWKQGASPLPKL
jgi:hypothetical protein